MSASAAPFFDHPVRASDFAPLDRGCLQTNSTARVGHPHPYGPRRPGQTFEDWLAAGLLVMAENERDRIRDADWQRKASNYIDGPDPDYANRLIRHRHTRESIERRAYHVARGFVTLSMQSALVAHDCPEHAEELIALLESEAADWIASLEQAERRVRWKVRPLCEQKLPGERIIAYRATIWMRICGEQDERT